MFAQADLFKIDVPSLPEGMRYGDELLSPGQEHSLVRYIAQLPLKPFEFAGGFKGNRRVLSFGFRYDYSQQRLIEAAPIPEELHDARKAIALWSGHCWQDLKQALITEYAPGAGIGWHRDKKMFADVIGVSLLAPCTFRLRRRQSACWERMSLEVEPRSAYVLTGPARSIWEHSIPPMDHLRYSITFRSFVS